MSNDYPALAPWKRNIETGSIEDANGHIICDIIDDNGKGANAHLIASTPELLEALKAVKAYDAAIQRHACKGESWVGGDDLDELYSDFITKTNKAINKAEGNEIDLLERK